MINGDSALPASTDVVVAGGGPSGLFLAVDLAQRGVGVVVLEPRVELDWLRPRAKTTNARTMTHLRRLGLAGELRAAAPLPVDYSEDVIFCTSLVGTELRRFEHAFQLHRGRYELQPECGQQVAQPVVEQVLRGAVEREPNATLALGTTYVRTERSAPECTTVVAADATGTERTIQCRYLVGADGVSSAVRSGLGVRLEGGSAAKSNLGVLFRSTDLADRVTLDPAVQYWVVGRTYAGMVGAMDLDGLWWCIVQGYDANAPQFAYTSIEDMLRDLIGADVDVDVVAEDPWTARMLLAPSYRVGSTFLVGDAAHANPPWGGHGFNTCIGDAANLAWKLAAVLQGRAPETLLDTYEAERRPIARRTIDDAAANGEVLADDLIDPALDANGPDGDAARARAASALTVKESEFSSLGLVLGYDYAGSPAVTPSGAPAPPPDPISYRPSAAPGCLLPHAWLDDSTSVYDVLGTGFTVLIDANAAGSHGIATFQAAVEALPAEAPLSVRAVYRSEGGLAAQWDAPAVLVRPDQHVAWRGDDASALVAAVHRALAGGGSERHPAGPSFATAH